MKAVFFVLPVLMLLMFGLGLELERRNFTDLLARPRPVLAGLLAQLVLLPALAFAVVFVGNLSPVLGVGLILIACCPGGSSSNVLSMLVGGNVALSITLTTLSSFLSVITVPLVLVWAMQAFLTDDKQVQLSFLQTSMQTGAVIILPVLVGMLVRRFKPTGAQRLQQLMRKLSLPLLLAIIVIFTIRQWPVLQAAFGELFLSLSLWLGLSVILGVGVARVFCLARPMRRTIVVEIAIQNAAYAIMIATSPLLLANETMAIPAIVYAVLMNLFVFS